MGSVQTTIECPNCKKDAIEDYYYRSGEVYIFCCNCGYLYSLWWKRDKNGNLILQDPEKGLKADNFIKEETIIKNPYCAYAISFPKSSTMGSFATEKEYREFDDQIDQIVEENNELDIQSITTSRLKDGKIVRHTLYINQLDNIENEPPKEIANESN